MPTMKEESPKAKSKKRKILSNHQSIESCEEKHHKRKEKKSKKIYHKKSVGNDKFKTSLEQKEQLNQKSPKTTKNEYKEFLSQGNRDNQIELELWYYLLYHLEESEKLVALKLLIGINKMKQSWNDNYIKDKYVDKKEYDDMKRMIIALQDAQEKNEAEKQKLIQKNKELEEKVKEEIKCRSQLATILANEIEKSKRKAPNKVEASDKIETTNKIKDKQQSQTTTDVVSKQKPSTSTSPISLNDSNNNAQVFQKKRHTEEEVDLRDLLNYKENERISEHHVDSVSHGRHCTPFMPHSLRKNIPKYYNSRLFVYIQTSIRHFPDLMRLIENKLRISMRHTRAIPTKNGWKIKFPSQNAKLYFLQQKKHFIGTGLYITNSF